MSLRDFLLLSDIRENIWNDLKLESEDVDKIRTQQTNNEQQTIFYKYEGCPDFISYPGNTLISLTVEEF